MTAFQETLTWEQKEWAYEKWCEGYTQQDIANALFVCRDTVKKAIHGRPKIMPILKYDGKTELKHQKSNNTDYLLGGKDMIDLIKFDLNEEDFSKKQLELLFIIMNKSLTIMKGKENGNLL